MSDSDSNTSSSSSDSDSSSEDEEFHDGYGEDLMGDEEDRARLEQMTEKEREQELFNRIETSARERWVKKQPEDNTEFLGPGSLEHRTIGPHDNVWGSWRRIPQRG